LHGDEEFISGDAGYQGAEKREELKDMHVPAQFDHPFRFNPITDFGLIRSLISDLSDQN